MNAAETALCYLQQDVVLHIDMIESIRRGDAHILDASYRGVLLYNTAGEVYQLSAVDAESAREMTAAVGRPGMTVTHQDFAVPIVQTLFSLEETFFCLQAAYLSKERLPIPAGSPEFRPLDASHLAFVAEHYTHITDESYIRERLESGSVLGAFRGDTIVAFMGMHSEGSMGMLEVLPEYRRQGIALALESAYANRLLAQGQTPFAQIVTDNTASLELHRKMGFAISSQELCWVM